MALPVAPELSDEAPGLEGLLDQQKELREVDWFLEKVMSTGPHGGDGVTLIYGLRTFARNWTVIATIMLFLAHIILISCFCLPMNGNEKFKEVMRLERKKEEEVKRCSHNVDHP